MNIKVTATGACSGPIDWDIDGKKPKDAAKEFAKNTGPHTVKFRLDDKTGRNLRFDCRSPFWDHIDDAGKCPPPGSHSDQTEVISCSEKELTVINKNSGDPCTVHYQLNFVDAAGTAEPLDPEFKNGGST